MDNNITMTKGFMMKTLLALTFIFISFLNVAATTDWIKFNLEDGHIKIPAAISGIETFAILDTGAQSNAINPAFITSHDLSFDKGKKVNVRGVFGVDKKQTFNNVPVSFFGIDTHLDSLINIGLGSHKNGLLFGSTFFNQFLVQLDYPNERIRLISSDSIDLSELKNIDMRKKKGSGIPIVKVGLPNNKEVWLMLDTGNSGGMIIERRLAKSMGWLENLKTDVSISIGATTLAQMENFRIPQLTFGPYELENILVSTPLDGQPIGALSKYRQSGSRIKGRKVQGIIGYDVLKHFLITIDYKSGDAHIGLPDTPEKS